MGGPNINACVCVSLRWCVVSAKQPAKEHACRARHSDDGQLGDYSLSLPLPPFLDSPPFLRILEPCLVSTGRSSHRARATQMRGELKIQRMSVKNQVSGQGIHKALPHILQKRRKWQRRAVCMTACKNVREGLSYHLHSRISQRGEEA